MLFPFFQGATKGSALSAISTIVKDFILQPGEAAEAPEVYQKVSSRLSYGLLLLFLSYLGGCIVVLLLSLALTAVFQDLIGRIPYSLPLAYLCTCSTLVIVSLFLWMTGIKTLSIPLVPEDLFVDSTDDNGAGITRIEESNVEPIERDAVSYIQLACTSGTLWVWNGNSWIEW